MTIKNKIKKIKHRIFPKNKPDQKVFILESDHPDRADLVLPETRIHDSVFEENHSLDDHPEKAFTKAVFSWVAPEYHQHPKSVQWWVTAGVVLLIALILEAVSGNWTFLVATLVFALVYWYTEIHHPPRHTKIILSSIGVKIGHTVIPFNQIKNFWVIYNPPEVKKLYLRLRRYYLADLIIELENQDPLAIRKFLGEHLEELPDRKETVSEFILRTFKL